MARLLIFGLIALLLFGCITPPAENQSLSNVTNTTGGETTPTCNDNDGGVNILSKGKVTSNTGVFVDSCVNSNSVSEYSCSGTSPISEVIICPTGTTCSNGACIAQAIQQNTTMIDCIDSDNGADYFVAGTVTYHDEPFSDSCVGASSIQEYSCVDDELYQETINCGVGNICKDNACLKLTRTCTDSDTANEYAIGTTVQYGGGVVIQTKSDGCIDSHTINEFYCNGTEISTKSLSCPANTACSGGFCAPLCNDKDGGVQTHVASYVTDQSGSYSDYCIDDYVLVEYVCDSDTAVFTETTCAGICKNGRCYELNEIDCKESNAGRTITLSVDYLTIKTSTDSCIDYKTKNDYRCFGGTIDSVSVECDSDEFCYAGSCQKIVSAACYDLDEYASNKGKAVPSQVIVTDDSSVLRVKSDFCFTPAILTEFMCDGTNYVAEQIECGMEEECIDGACVYPYTCVDNHQGSSVGSVTLMNDGAVVRTEKDACTSDHVQRRVSCDEYDKIMYSLVECPSGTTCDSVDGACK